VATAVQRVPVTPGALTAAGATTAPPGEPDCRLSLPPQHQSSPARMAQVWIRPALTTSQSAAPVASTSRGVALRSGCCRPSWRASLAPQRQRV
jgi:hypothetical protein